MPARSTAVRSHGWRWRSAPRPCSWVSSAICCPRSFAGCWIPSAARSAPNSIPSLAAILIPPDMQTEASRSVPRPVTGRSAAFAGRFAPRSASPFDRLVLFSWRNELLRICSGMMLSFLLAGFWFPYWRVADMDFFVVYNAFLLNTPLPQEFFDHPGYLSILLLSYWLRALHALGLVQVYTFAAVPPLSDAAGFADAWTQATRAGRVLSFIDAVAFVLAFSYLLRAVVRDWRVAALGGFMLAFSGGMAMQMRMLRTELLLAGLFMVALLMLMVAAVRGPRAWRPLVVGLASLLITLALLNKVQVLFLIGTLPLLLIFVGPGLDGAKSGSPGGFWRVPSRAWPVFGATLLTAALVAYAAKDIVL